MKMELYEKLRVEEAELVFGGGRSMLHPYDGLLTFGPYELQKNYEEVVIIYEKENSILAKQLNNHLNMGYSRYFPKGFNSIFRNNPQVNFELKEINKYNIDPVKAAEEIYEAFKENGVSRRFPLIVIEKTPKTQEYNIYFETKSRFTQEGIPTQFITTDVLKDPNRYKWSVFPLAIQIFVKMGGKPYVLSSPIGLDSDDVITLIMGAGLTRIPSSSSMNNNNYMGFLVMFGPNGEWMTIKSHTQPYDRDEIPYALHNLVIETTSYAIDHLAGVQGNKIHLIIHYSGKNFSGKEEIYLWKASEKIREARGYSVIPHVVKLQPQNDYVIAQENSPCLHPKWNDLTGHPLVGTTIKVTEDFYMLFTTGCLKIKDKWRPNTLGTPSPLLISIKSLRNINYELKPIDLIKSVFHLCRLNYMSINNPVNKEPITTKYAKELAYMISKLRGNIPKELEKTLWFI